MRKKSNKLLKVGIGLFGVSILGISFLPISNNNQYLTKLSVEKNNSLTNTREIDSTTQNLTFTVNDNPTWKGTKFADEVTNEDIKGMLTPSLQFGANYYVKLLPITSDMLTQGYVEFVVVQLLPTFTNGVNSGSLEKKYIAPSSSYEAFPKKTLDSKDSESTTTIDGENVENTNIWTTKNVTGLFLQRKYSFKWNSDSEIGDFLKTTDSKALTSQQIMSNFVSTADSTDILPSGTTGEFKQDKLTYASETSSWLSTTTKAADSSETDSISSQDAETYGVGLVSVNFGASSTDKSTMSNDSDWVGGKKPTIAQSSRIVRGLVGTDGSKEIVHLNVSNDANVIKDTVLDLKKIKAANSAFVYPFNATGDTAKISDFTPSQLINALNGDLTSLLTKTDYVNSVSKDTTLPAIYVTYMGKNAFTNPSLPFDGTGLSHQINVPYVDKDYNPIMNGGSQQTTGSNSVNNIMNITSVTGSADDINGTLDLKIKYNYYDVYKNVIISNYEVPITITGLQTNDDANKNLFFQWKSDDDLTYSSANDFMNAYNENKSDTTYIQDLSNSLFFGSSDTYQLPRKLELTQNTSNKKQITATITFDSFGDSYYTDTSGKHKGLKTTKTFTFAKESSSGSVKFNTTANVKNSISNWSSLSPEKLINDISTGVVNKNIFFANTYSSNTYSSNTKDARDTTSGEQILFIPNETNNGIIVRVNKNGEMYQSSFTGLKQGQSSNYIYNFSFTPDETSDNYKKLLSIPLEEITKQDIIDLYLKDLDIFKNTNGQFELSPDDITLTPDPNTGSLEISVNVKEFDSTDPNANRIFKTTIQGLYNQNLIDNNSYVAPLNLTIPLSATFAGLLTIGLSVALFLIIRKRVKLNKINKANATKK